MAGASAAFSIQRELRRRHAVTLVSPTPHLQLKQSLVRMAFGFRRREAVFDLRQALEEKGIGFRQASITKIDYQNSLVETTAGSMHYDYLMLALGASWERKTIAGWENAFYLGSLEEAVQFNEALQKFSGKSFSSATSFGNEWEGPALETIFRAHEFFSRQGVRKQARLHYITFKKRPFKELGEKVSALIEEELAGKKIELRAGEKLVQVTRGGVNTDKSAIDSDLTVVFPPYSGNPALAGCGLVGKKNFVLVNEFMQSKSSPRVFAAGDCVNTLSVKLGFNALSGAVVAGKNLASTILGKPLKKFVPKIVYVMELGGGEGLLINSRLKNGEWHSHTTRGEMPFIRKLAFEKSFLKEKGLVHYVLGEKLG